MRWSGVLLLLFFVYTLLKKGLAVFPSPARILLTKLSLAVNNLPCPSPRKVWSKQIQESYTFFLQCIMYLCLLQILEFHLLPQNLWFPQGRKR